MSTEAMIVRETKSDLYEAVLRTTEALSRCHEPERLATTLADEISKFLHFDHLYLAVSKENSNEVQFRVWGKGPIPSPDLPLGELQSREAINCQDQLHTADWSAEDESPRFKQLTKETASLGSSAYQ